MRDGKILAACLDSAEAYYRVKPHVDKEDFSPFGQFWWKFVESWYESDPNATSVDRDILRSRGERQATPKHEETLLAWFDDLGESVSADNVTVELLDLKRFTKGNELCAAIQSGKSTQQLRQIVAGYDELLQAADLQAQSTLIEAAQGEDLFEVLATENKIKLYPKKLNDRCDGGALPGDHIVIFARPEMGKTLFCVNLARGFLEQGLKVLYIGNEDKIDKIKMRLLCSIVNKDKDTVYEHKDRALRIARKSGFEDRLSMFHLQPGTPNEIEDIVIQTEPNVLILDQIRNLNTTGSEKGITARLNQVAIDIRAILSKYELIGVSTSQAHAGEHGKAQVWLDSGDMDSSRTGLPAQADLMIGIGGNENMIQHGTRAISLCKNKLSGNHEGFEVMIDERTSRVK